MLVVTVDLWPGGDSTKAQRLGRATLVNDGTGTVGRGNYVACLFLAGAALTPWKRVEVCGFPRLTRNGWDLLFRALRKAVGGRNLEVKRG